MKELVVAEAAAVVVPPLPPLHHNTQQDGLRGSRGAGDAEAGPGTL